MYTAENSLYGLCEELEILSGSNVIETFILDAQLPVGGWWTTGGKWARLDSTLRSSQNSHSFIIIRVG